MPGRTHASVTWRPMRPPRVQLTSLPSGRVTTTCTSSAPLSRRSHDTSTVRGATLRSWKGHRFLVEAVVGLPESVGLVIVGDGPQRDVLEVLVDKHHMRPRIWFANNQRDVLPWLQSLDVFALPSYANEGVPQALVQAMLVGLPSVTTHAGSIAEVAIDGKTALIVEKENVSALRSALERLIGNESLRKTLGLAAREHCAQHYSYDRMLDRMEEIYRQVSGRY